MVDPHNDHHDDFVIRRDDDAGNPEDYSREDNFDNGGGIGSKKSLLPYIIGGVAVLILIVVGIVLLVPPRNSADANQLQAMEAKIRQLEKRLATIDAIDQALTRLDKQQVKFDTLTRRLDRFETTVNTQLDQVIKELGILHKQTDHLATPGKPASRKATRRAKTVPAKKRPQYHQVRAGETLYRIGRRYGLTVKQLQGYNKIGPGVSIHPGQKLRLSPPPKP